MKHSLLLALLLLCALPASAEDTSTDPSGWFGFNFRAQEDGAQVKMVFPGTPADAAGMKVGDRLLAVDGKSLAGLKASEVITTMAGPPGSTAQLEVRRGTEELTLTAVRGARPDKDAIEALRMEATIAAAPPQRRAQMRLSALAADASAADVKTVWQRYLEDRGEQPVKETVVVAVLKRLMGIGTPEAAKAIDEVIGVADEALLTQPRYHRRVADMYLGMDPPRLEATIQRARLGLEHAPADHGEYAWLLRALGEAMMGQGDVEGALTATAAALESWSPPTLLWFEPGERTPRAQVVDGHSRLAQLRATVLRASGDDAGAEAVLRQRLRYRYEAGCADQLAAMGLTPPKPPRPAVPLEAARFPDFTLPLLSGDGELSLADLAGKPTLVVLWASWCGPCKAELAHLKEVHAELAAEGIEVLAINVMDNAGDARTAMEANGWPFPVLLDSDQQLTRELGIQSIPRAYALDPGGVVAETYQGYSSATAVEQRALLISLAGGGSSTPHLFEVEVGDERLVPLAVYPLPGATTLAAGKDGDTPLVVAGSVHGTATPFDAEGLRGDDARESPVKLKYIEVLPGGTWVAVAKKHVALLPPAGEPQLLVGGKSVSAVAVAGDQLVVAMGGRGLITGYDSEGQELWTGGGEAVTWALIPLTLPDGKPGLGRLRPDGLQLLTADGTPVETVVLPGKPSKAGSADGIAVISGYIRAVTTGDLDGDGDDERVVLLKTRQVVGYGDGDEVLFRFTLPVDGDILCADLDGDGRDELWVASAATGVACLRIK